MGHSTITTAAFVREKSTSLSPGKTPTRKQARNKIKTQRWENEKTQRGRESPGKCELLVYLGIE